jgi:hypothetical protein
MSTNNAWVAQTEQRIAEVDALQQIITDLQNELHVFHETLRKEIASLRQPPTFTAPATPSTGSASGIFQVPARPSAPVSDEPAAPTPPSSSRQMKLPSRRAIDDEVEAEMAATNGPQEEEEAAPEEAGVGGRPVSVQLSNGLGDGDPQNGWIIDRPPGGLRILVDEPVQTGIVMSIRATKDHPQNQWVNVSVKSCRPERNSYVVNVHFVERPPWAVMNLLNGG